MATRKLPAILTSPQSQAVYLKLLDVIRRLGPFEVEEKKTSLHLTRGRAFAGVHPRAAGLIVNLVLDRPVRNDRVHKCKRVSTHRYHVEFKLQSPDDLDAQLTSWIGQAYGLTA